MSGTQAVTPAPVQLPKEPVYTGKKGKCVHDPTHKGLECLTRYRRHEREGHRGFLGRARLRLPGRPGGW